MVIISRDIGMKQESQKLVAVLGETLGQSFGVSIPIGDPENVCQPNMQIGDLSTIHLLANALALNDEPQRFVNQTLKPPCKAQPFCRTVGRNTCLISRSRCTTHFCLANA